MKMPAKIAVSVATILTLVATHAGGAAENFAKPQLRCGSYCLYIAMKSVDLPVTNFQAVESKLGQPGALGYSMDQLAVAARSFGAHVEGVETSLESLQNIRGRFSCIAFLDKGHFVNIAEITDGQVFVIDPPVSKSVDADAFRAIWQGKALLISGQPLDTTSKYINYKDLLFKILSVVFVIALLGFSFVLIRRRFRLRYLLAISCCLFASCKENIKSQAHSIASIDVSPNLVDLGTGLASSNGELRAMVNIKNLGTEPLRIASIKSSCGCTVVSPPRSNLEPDQSDRFEVVVKIGLQAGPRSSNLTIESNDPIRPSLVIPVQWKSEPRMSVEPDKLNFGDVSPGQKLKREIRIRTLSNDSMPTMKAHCLRPEVAISLVGAPGDERRILVDMVVGTETGDQSGTISLASDNEELASLIPLQWHVKAKLSATPSSLFSVDVERGMNIENRLIVLSEDQPFGIETVKIGEDANMELENETKTLNLIHTIKVRITAPEKPGIYRNIVHITTTLGKDYQLEIPWSIIVK